MLNARSKRLYCRLLAAAIALASAFVSAGAGAQDSPQARAAEEFKQGAAAFGIGDYLRAGEAFERAYTLAPHPDALWNAARAFHRLGERARAANLYARYLREAAPGAADRDAATRALAELGPTLGRLDVFARDVSDITIDAAKLEGTSVYVNPGTHEVRGHAGARVVTKNANVDAGGVVSVALMDEAPPPPPPTVTPIATARPIDAVNAPLARKPLSPWFVAVGGGLTAVGAGLTIAFGVDTLNQKSVYDAAPTPANLNLGYPKMVRTNVALAITGGLAALTAGTAFFFVDWSPKRASVGAGPSGVAVRGTF
jgi:hypothetical protein